MAQNNALKSGIELHVVLSIENGFLGGPCNYDSCFTYGGHEYRICIEQFGIRRISIACEKPVDCSLLLNIFESIEWLLMMFDGRFMTIKSMEIFDSEERSEKYSTTIEKYLKGRLKLYNSADFCRRNMKAIDFYKIDIVAILPKWMKLLDELKIVHPMLLYSVSDTGLPVDCKCATIIQVFEPLTELMKTNLSGYRVVPARPANGKNSWLRRCLETAIRQYGSLIFEKELGNEDKIFNFTDQLKDCRHRIMHISSKQNKKYMSDTQNVLYAAKLFLLYRVIIFNLLGISKELYEQAINVIAKQWDDWYDFVNKGHEFIT